MNVFNKKIGDWDIGRVGIRIPVVGLPKMGPKIKIKWWSAINEKGLRSKVMQLIKLREWKLKRGIIYKNKDKVD